MNSGAVCLEVLIVSLDDIHPVAMGGGVVLEDYIRVYVEFIKKKFFFKFIYF